MRLQSKHFVGLTSTVTTFSGLPTGLGTMPASLTGEEMDLFRMIGGPPVSVNTVLLSGSQFGPGERVRTNRTGVYENRETSQAFRPLEAPGK